ncbi:MAG: LysM peptidoglycan-binding domain-containing protein, partial [Alphaproteobacteria bacterium]|nr:LysM peptidoglycan-binding domain-containing protein [Alphaproteobacteria bacterium]
TLITAFSATRPADRSAAAGAAHRAAGQVDFEVSAGLSGPMEATPFEIPPTFTHLRLNLTTKRGLFAGRGEANARIVLLREGRAVADTSADERGAWQIATAVGVVTGTNRFSVEQRSLGGSNYITGETIRVVVPPGHSQSISLSNEPASLGFRMVAVRAEGDDIGSAASRRFDQFFMNRSGAKGLEGATHGAVRTVAADRDDTFAPAWNWLRDANRSYNREIVPRIKRGGGYGSSAGHANSTEAGRDTDTSRTRGAVLPDRNRAPEPNQVSRHVDLTGRIAGSLPIAVAEWFEAARRGYAAEVVPRLKGQVPTFTIARPRDGTAIVETETESEAARQRRLERDRRRSEEAEARAEQERQEADRRRRDAEQARLQAEEEARRIEADRLRAEQEEARKLAGEQRRAAERRAQEERLAAEERRRREDEARLAREAVERERSARETAEMQAAADRVRREAEAKAKAKAETQAARLSAEAERRRQAAAAEQQRRLQEAEQERRRLAELERERRSVEADRRQREAEQERERIALQRQQQRVAAERDRLVREAAGEEARRQRVIAEAAEQRRHAEEARRRRAAEAERRRQAEAEPERRRGPASHDGGEGNSTRGGLTEETAPNTLRIALPSQRKQEPAAPPLLPVQNRRVVTLSRPAAPERQVSDREDMKRQAANRPAPERESAELSRTYVFRDTSISYRSAPRSATVTAPADTLNRLSETRTAGAGNQAQVRHATVRHRRRARVGSFRKRLARTPRCRLLAGRRIRPPGTYVVKRGDSLWRISRRHYRIGRYYRIIYRSNSGTVRRPGLIYPCQRLFLPRWR